MPISVVASAEGRHFSACMRRNRGLGISPPERPRVVSGRVKGKRLAADASVAALSRGVWSILLTPSAQNAVGSLPGVEFPGFRFAKKWAAPASEESGVRPRARRLGRVGGPAKTL